MNAKNTTSAESVPSIWEIKDISDNLNVLFNSNNKQVRLNEIENDPDYAPFFSQEKEVTFMVPGRKSFKSYFSWNKKKETIKIVINDMGDLAKGTLFLIFFPVKGQTCLAQCELADIASNMTRSHITNYITLKALDPRKHKRKDISKEIKMYTVPQSFVDEVKGGSRFLYRRQLNKPTTQSAKKILAQDHFLINNEIVYPLDALKQTASIVIEGNTLDLSLGGTGLKVSNSFQDALSKSILVYIELTLHMRGIYRRINIFASPRAIKPSGSNELFVALMFIDNLLPTVFK